MAHLFVKFAGPRFIGFEISCGINRQTNSGKNRTMATAFGVGNSKRILTTAATSRLF